MNPVGLALIDCCEVRVRMRVVAGLVAALVVAGCASLEAPGSLARGEWTAWRGDGRGAGYAPIDQINRHNAGDLKVMWRWSSADFGPAPEARNTSTPLMVDGVLYATAGDVRSVVALDAATGALVWAWRGDDPQARYDNAPRKGTGRGVAYWSDGEDARILTVTPGFRLVALDAATGEAIAGFGEGGVVDLMVGLRGAPEGRLADIGNSSPPLIAGDVAVVGPAHIVSFFPGSDANVKGDVRGFDVRTGELLWTFHTIPVAGEAGYETWAEGTAERAGNAGVWAPMAYDEESGAIFLPVEAGTSDLYGGGRIGSNAHSSSLVSLDGATGEMRWAQQLVHHDIWDWDVPAAPILADVPWEGGVKRAVLQVTKQGFVFAFDRDTGAPLWPVEERAVPVSDVAGEASWPTQPMPFLPEPFERQGVTQDDLIDFTPELRAKALEAVKDYRMGAFMAPASMVDDEDGTRGTLSLPSLTGGANWEGAAYDPGTGMLFVGSATRISVLALRETGNGAMPYVVAPPIWAPDVDGLPLVKPPYGRITAIDMKTGKRAWTMANADTPKAIADHPALAGIDVGRTGIATRAGLLVTDTLLFAGEGEGGSPVLRAHDKASGEIVAEIDLPGTQTGLPMSYVLGGKQFIALAVMSGDGPAEIVALGLGE